MPLFGSKKDKSKSEEAKKGYPSQQTAPPPMQQPQYAPSAPQGAPPPYTQYPQGGAPGYAAPTPYYGAPHPANMPYGAPYGAPPQANMPYGAPPHQLAPMHPQAGPRQTVMVQGGFDAGARFDGIAQPNIPPPPPGCAPNIAQVAQMQGQNVVMTQRQGNFLTGGSDGGYVWF